MRSRRVPRATQETNTHAAIHRHEGACQERSRRGAEKERRPADLLGSAEPRHRCAAQDLGAAPIVAHGGSLDDVSKESRKDAPEYRNPQNSQCYFLVDYLVTIARRMTPFFLGGVIQ